MLVITAPGQGAQAPGFLSPWLDLPGFADRLGAWSELAGADLIQSGTTASADQIRDTAVAQPLLVAAAIAAAEALFGGLDQARAQAGAVAGHSVGELAAGAIAGVLSPEDAMRLVGVRGRAMARAAADQPTGMTAVLGGDEAAVLDAIEALGLTPANINGAGQIVAAGTLDQLEKFAAEPPGRAPAPARSRWPAPSTPSTWRRRWTRSARPRPRCRSATQPCCCCRTGTGPSSAPAPTGWSGS